MAPGDGEKSRCKITVLSRMNNFCTLFDSYYLSRGIAMHDSLAKQAKSFHLYIFPFDDIAYRILAELNLEHVTLVKMSDFEDEELLRIKPTRTKGEYCWTCTPSIILYCIKKYNLQDCTYLDADLYFFSDPAVLVDELGEDSILITEHRYSKEYADAITSGIYCVQFISFKNNRRGLIALNWWRERCIEWCYDRLEDGKFGDQKYLNDWTARFEGVHILQNLGGGVAPWNVQQYKIEKDDSTYWISDQKQRVELGFYHFHWVKFQKNNMADVGAYDLAFPYIQDIYADWLKTVMKIDQMLFEKFNFSVIKPKDPILKALRSFIRTLRRKVEGKYKVIDLKTFSIRG